MASLICARARCCSPVSASITRCRTAATWPGAVSASFCRPFAVSSARLLRLSVAPRLDIAPPPGLAPLAELNVANGFLAFITGTAVAQEYRDRFAALIGPATGPEYR